MPLRDDVLSVMALYRIEGHNQGQMANAYEACNKYTSCHDDAMCLLPASCVSAMCSTSLTLYKGSTPPQSREGAGEVGGGSDLFELSMDPLGPVHQSLHHWQLAAAFPYCCKQLLRMYHLAQSCASSKCLHTAAPTP